MFEIKYRSSATCFEEAFPMGNGRIGGMVYGDAVKERISLNEDGFWSGYGKRDEKKDGYLSFEKARILTKEGKFHEAYEEIDQHFLSSFSESYMPVGNLWIETTHIHPREYCRALDLETGIAKIIYFHNNSKYEKKVFFSESYDVMFYTFQVFGSDRISLKLGLESPLSHKVKVFSDCLVMETEAPGHVRPRYGSSSEMDPESICYYEESDKRGLTAVTRVKIFSDGIITQKGRDYSHLYVDHAKYIYVAAAINTSGRNIDPNEQCRKQLNMLLKDKKMDEIVKQAENLHIKDCEKLFRRSAFYLNDRMNQSFWVEDILKKCMDEKSDNKEEKNLLTQILYQWGRYLMIASSRPGSHAINLQGIWNEDIRPIWSCNYTTNINLQMCYWPCMAAGLEELSEPYFHLIKELEEAGRETAWDYYRARGSVVHHNTDIWKITHPVGFGKPNAPTACYWNLAGGWFVKSIWDAYLYTRDMDFLKEYYPVIEGFVAFYCDILEEENGEYYLMPSTSPENRFFYPGEKDSSTSISKLSTMSISIIREALHIYLKASGMMGTVGMKGSRYLVEKTGNIVEKLPDYQIGSKGQLLEWEQEFEEVEKKHRHISHLYGFYPGNDIDWKDERLCHAVKQSMRLRGDEGTGWSLAWKTGVWARLGEGEMAGKLLRRFMKVTTETDANKSIDGGGICPNLLCNCPPVQIDGNFGITAGVIEMILQSDEEEIRVLPAILQDWKKGLLTGIRTKCGLIADIEWEEKGKEGITVSLVLVSSEKKTIQIWRGKNVNQAVLIPGKNKFIFQM